MIKSKNMLKKNGEKLKKVPTKKIVKKNKPKKTDVSVKKNVSLGELDFVGERLLLVKADRIKRKKNGEKLKLTERHELFCHFFVERDFFGNGTEAYVNAYRIDITKKGAYASARVCASRLLQDVNILDFINSILEHANLNDPFVDRELSFLIQQKANLGAKIRAIQEYNKVKKRVDESPKISNAVIIIPDNGRN